MNYETYQQLIYAWMALGVIISLVLLKVVAPYGWYSSSKWGPQISNRLGWILMEIPGMMVLMYFMLSNGSGLQLATGILVAFYLFHYINRVFIFPFRIHTRGKNCR